MNRAQPTSAQAQQVFITCISNRRVVSDLVDDIDSQGLVGHGATILLYGFSQKTQNGFIVVEAAHTLPFAFLRWLRRDSRIIDYCVYDVPCSEQERLAVAEWASAYYSPRLDAPALPAGYTLLAEPVSLDRPSDEIWLAYVLRSDASVEGAGILVYQERGEIFFLAAEEAITVTAALLEIAPVLGNACSDGFLQAPQHAERLEVIRRAVVATEPEPHEPARQTPTAAAIQELDAWVARHHYRLVPDVQGDGLHLIPDDQAEGEAHL